MGNTKSKKISEIGNNKPKQVGELKQKIKNHNTREYSVFVDSIQRAIVIDKPYPGPGYEKDFDSGNHIQYSCEDGPNKYFFRGITLKQAQKLVYECLVENDEREKEIKIAAEFKALHAENKMLKETINKQRMQINNLTYKQTEQVQVDAHIVPIELSEDSGSYYSDSDTNQQN
jgi:hypothetical protein